MTNIELAEALKSVKVNLDENVVRERARNIKGELATIKRYTNKYSVASHAKTNAMEFSNATYELYHLLISKLSEILPSDENNGKLLDKGEFYITADAGRNELIKITVQKTNGVSVNPSCAVESYSDAQRYRSLIKEFNTLRKASENAEKIERLAKTLSELLATLSE